MEQKQYFIVACVVLIGILIGAVGLVYVWLPNTTPGTVANPGGHAEAKPEIHLYKKAGGLILQWNNLPKGTQKVTIFRAKLGTEDWEPWRTFEIDSTTLANGFIEIKTNEELKVYSFYAEATRTSDGTSSSTGSGGSGGDTVLWQSSSTTIEALPPNFPGFNESPTSSTPTTPSSGEGNQTSTTPTNETTQPSSTSTPSNNASGTSSQAPTSTGVYYSPDGTITGTVELQHDDFWVEHVNRSIEIGWQNIPTATNLIVVYRSKNSSGPWLELFRQTDPVSPSSLRLLDNTLTTAHYYRMDARSNAGILKAYDPVFLPAYE